MALGSARLSAAPVEETLVTRTLETTYELSVPVSALVMSVPRGDLVPTDSPRSGAGNSPRYFHLVDTKHGIIISGWFESARTYGGFDAFWKGETDAWEKGHLPAPRNISLQKFDGWDLALYDLDVPGGSNTHVRAEWVSQGTWIDVHISVTTADRIEVARASALAVLKGIHVAAAH
jgi:hypothetical protein